MYNITSLPILHWAETVCIMYICEEMLLVWRSKERQKKHLVEYIIYKVHNRQHPLHSCWKKLHHNKFSWQCSPSQWHWFNKTIEFKKQNSVSQWMYLHYLHYCMYLHLSIWGVDRRHCLGFNCIDNGNYIHMLLLAHILSMRFWVRWIPLFIVLVFFSRKRARRGLFT